MLLLSGLGRQRRQGQDVNYSEHVASGCQCKCCEDARADVWMCVTAVMLRSITHTHTHTHTRLVVWTADKRREMNDRDGRTDRQTDRQTESGGGRDREGGIKGVA